MIPLTMVPSNRPAVSAAKVAARLVVNWMVEVRPKMVEFSCENLVFLAARYPLRNLASIKPITIEGIIRSRKFNSRNIPKFNSVPEIMKNIGTNNP